MAGRFGLPVTFKRGLLARLRAAHDAPELERLRTAVSITAAGHASAAAATVAGVSERDVQTQLEYAFYAAGATGLSYPSIVGSGPNATVLHYPGAGRRLQDGDLVVIDAGAVIKSWQQIAASLPKAQANLSALLNSVKMIDVHGNTLILGLASDVLVSKIDKPDQIEAMQKLIKVHFGVDVNIRCTVTTAKGKIPPNVAQDGMVATAIQHGGEIVDMQD